MARNYAQIVEFLKTKINTMNNKIKTHPGSLVSDIVIEGPAQEFHKLYENSENISKNQSLETADPSGLKAAGYNLNLKRKSGAPSTVIITFYSNNAPVSDITIPIGTIITTRLGITSNEIRFRTLKALKMYASLSSTYLNTSTGKYEVSTDAECLTTGVVGNIGSYNINTILGNVTGINGCYNASPSSGGLDPESDENFKQRIALAQRGNTLGTPDGLLSIIFENENVEDAIIVSNGDSTRSELGAVDIYVKGLKISQFTDTFPILQGMEEFIFTKKPITFSEPTVLIFSDGVVSAGSYLLERDSTSEYLGSILCTDKIVWDGDLNPDSGNIYVIYTYNSLIEELQNLFNATDKDLMNTDILIHWARNILINLTFSIRLLTGFDEVTVKALIRNNLASFFNNTKIGEEIQQSDVAGVIINTQGVDDVLLPLTLFKSDDGTIFQNALGNLQIPNNAYASLGTVTINISI